MEPAGSQLPESQRGQPKFPPTIWLDLSDALADESGPVDGMGEGPIGLANRL
jgi:hypothetical protein